MIEAQPKSSGRVMRIQAICALPLTMRKATLSTSMKGSKPMQKRAMEDSE